MYSLHMNNFRDTNMLHLLFIVEWSWQYSPDLTSNCTYEIKSVSLRPRNWSPDLSSNHTHSIISGEFHRCVHQICVASTKILVDATVIFSLRPPNDFPRYTYIDPCWHRMWGIFTFRSKNYGRRNGYAFIASTAWIPRLLLVVAFWLKSGEFNIYWMEIMVDATGIYFM